MTFIKNKKDIAAYLSTCPVVLESKAAYEDGAPGTFDEVEKELVEVVARFDDRPPYGTDWEAWLVVNIDEMVQEAVSIVM